MAAIPLRADSRSTFARRVLVRARELGLTKKALAARAQISRQALDNLLAQGAQADAAMPTVPTLLGLAVALKVHPYWLVDGLMADQPISLHLRAQMMGDRAGFVEDVTAPDGCVVAPGARFTKTWTAQILSDVPWRGRKLVCWDEHLEVSAQTLAGEPVVLQRLVPDVQELLLPERRKGEGITVSVNLTAPMTPGVAATCWLTTFEDGTPCYSESAGLWIVAAVCPNSAGSAGFARVLTA